MPLFLSPGSGYTLSNNPFESRRCKLIQFQFDMKKAIMGSSFPDIDFFDVKQAPLAPFNCDECSKGFTQKLRLICHKRSVHEDITFGCKECERVFKSYLGLHYHKKKCS